MTVFSQKKSMQEIIAYGKVQDGRLSLHAKEMLAKQLKQFPASEVQIVIKKRRNRRTDRQNSYYWGGVLTPISEHTGHTPEEMHEIFKQMFLTEKVVMYKDHEVKIYKSSANLGSIRFMDYIDRIIAEAATMGIRILSPDEYYEGQV